MLYISFYNSPSSHTFSRHKYKSFITSIAYSGESICKPFHNIHLWDWLINFLFNIIRANLLRHTAFADKFQCSRCSTLLSQDFKTYLRMRIIWWENLCILLFNWTRQSSMVPTIHLSNNTSYNRGEIYSNTFPIIISMVIWFVCVNPNKISVSADAFPSDPINLKITGTGFKLSPFFSFYVNFFRQEFHRAYQ